MSTENMFPLGHDSNSDLRFLWRPERYKIKQRNLVARSQKQPWFRGIPRPQRTQHESGEETGPALSPMATFLLLL